MHMTTSSVGMSKDNYVIDVCEFLLYNNLCSVYFLMLKRRVAYMKCNLILYN